MKKSFLLMLTFLLLFTMVVPLGSVQAGPGKGGTATAGSKRDAEGGRRESYSRDRRARSEDRDRGIDRDRYERDRYRSKSEDRDRDRDGTIKDLYGLPRGTQDPIHIAQNENRNSDKNEDKLPKDTTVKFTETERDDDADEIEINKRIKAYESWLEQESKKWINVITKEESKALERYTLGYASSAQGFIETQRQLRNNKGNPGSNDDIGYIDNIFKKMEPLSENIRVYRGSPHYNFSSFKIPNLREVLNNINKGFKYKHSMSPENYARHKNPDYNYWESLEAETNELYEKTGEDFRHTPENYQKFQENLKQLADLVKGRTMKDDGYMSTSLDPDIAWKYMFEEKEEDEDEIRDDLFLLELHVPKGAKVIAMTSELFPLMDEGDMEVILPRGTKCTIIGIDTYEDKYLKVIAEVKLPIDAKNAKFTFARDARSLGGQSEKYFMTDQNGYPWLFKVSGTPGNFDWVGEAEVGANKLLKALGLPSVEIRNETFNIPGRGNLSGSIQKMGTLKTWGLGKIPVSQLNNGQRRQLQVCQIVDYLIANLDAHEDNFGIDYRGNIIPFDKGQALKHLKDTSEITFGTSNPDSILSLVTENRYNAPYYPKMWDGWLKNQYEMDLMAVEPFIKTIESLSDTGFADMFRPYAEGREKQTGQSAKEFLDALVARKNTIRSKVDAFYKELAQKKGISFKGFSSEPANVPVDKLAS